MSESNKKTISKRQIWDSLNKDTQNFIKELTAQGFSLQAIQNNKGEVWKK